MFILLFLTELFILYLLSKSLTKELSHFFHRISKNKKITIFLLAILFLPGTIIHELSHFLMAKLLFVYSGKIQLKPKDTGSEIRMGTVAIGKTDPVRRFLIGAAPFVSGTGIMLSLLAVIIKYSLVENVWLLIAVIYIIFQIGNTMFSSKKDMEGSFLFVAITAILIALLYITGVKLPFELLNNTLITEVVRKAGLYLLVPLIFDAVILLSLKGLNR